MAEIAKERYLDPVKLREFVDIISSSSISVTLTPKTFSLLEKPIVLKGNNVKSIIKHLESSTALFIDSSLIPQANDLNKVIEVVQLRAKGELLNHENIDGLSSIRQVKYYTDAAYCLGLMKKNLTVTSSGNFLASRKDIDARYEVLADKFESSEFGWAWMKWSSVSTMQELEADTAEPFLNDCVPGLSSDTARRRSNTLKHWLNTLTKYRRDYRQTNKTDCSTDLSSEN